MRNNIIDGFLPGSGSEYSHNLYTSLSWLQSPGWSLGSGDLVEEDKSIVFVDPSNRNFRLKAGSPAIGNGIDVGEPEDLDGHTLPSGSDPDIGAYLFE